jgi:hypothetical protein
MRSPLRFAAVLATIALAGCQDGAFASGPSPSSATQSGACWVEATTTAPAGYPDLVVGVRIHYDVCPPDSVLASYGLRRVSPFFD